MTKMMRQRLAGFALVVICVLCVALASQGTTTEERDVTSVVLLLPLGIYAMTTKKYIMTDFDARNAEDQEHRQDICPVKIGESETTELH
jgi:uncharacterized membrane protein